MGGSGQLLLGWLCAVVNRALVLEVYDCREFAQYAVIVFVWPIPFFFSLFFGGLGHIKNNKNRPKGRFFYGFYLWKREQKAGRLYTPKR